ncbi:MAG: HAD-IA family hydrolase [Desulfobacterales bacterium]|nr:HAD-IA family hydrolase [Desulfobacterales bacterium]
MLKVIAFDCDGVMFDTRKANREYYNQLLSHFGRPPMSDAQMDFVHINTVEKSVAHLFDLPDFTAVNRYRKDMGYLRFTRFMEIEPDLKPLLAGLRKNYRTAVATNRTDTMDRVLEEFGLTDQFDLVVTALDVPNPKPAPDCLDKVARTFQAVPAEVMYIGDSILDQQAARAAGTQFVAYDNHDLEADQHIDSFKELFYLFE